MSDMTMRPATTQNPAIAKRDAQLAALARKHLRIETLETRNSDALDFHEIDVEGLKRLLIAAFAAGYEHAIETT